jgi:DNA-binding response OmpR family regulator
MRHAPVDLVVTDFDRDDAPSALVARSLHEDPRIERPFQIIALAGHVSPDLKLAATSAGIDEVIVKPMSPRYLLERVQARLSRMPVRAAATHHAKLGGNVVPLFPNSPHQPSH